MKKFILKFRKEEDGAISFEFMFMILFYFIWLTFSFVTFDVYLAYNKANKAGASIANLVSRMASLDNDYIDNLHVVYQNAANASADDTWMRISVIRNVDGEFKVRWSRTANDNDQEDPLLNEDPLIEKYVPNVVSGDEIVYLQARRTFSPLFKNTPWKDIDFNQNIVFIPRFYSELDNPDLVDFEDYDDGSIEPGPGNT